MSEDPLISVIVIFDRGPIEPCLSSLLAQEGVNFEIIAVVPDEEASKSLPSDPRLQSIAITDRNPATRRNLAAKKAQGKYLAFIDDDAAAPPDWLRRGVGFMAGKEGVAGVGGPNLAPPDAGLAERVTDMVLGAPLIGAGSRAYRGGGELAAAKPGEVHLVNLMVERQWFERVGGLNQELGYGGEDTEFMHLAGRMGARFFFDPAMTVFHRRRPFGFGYVRQRFRLRRQSARLVAAYPKIYAKSPAFLVALFSAPVLVAALALVPALRSEASLALMAALYVAAAICLSHNGWKDKPWLALLSPPAFALHHLVYIAGLWLGLAESILRGPGRIRREPGRFSHQG